MGERQLRLGPLTVEDYLAFENAAPRRHEYVSGRVYAMSGTTARHNRIALNIVTRLRTAAQGGPCQAYIIDIKVRAARDRFYYPDGIVACTPHSGDTLIFEDPCLIAEVTSRGTRRIDLGEKLDAYLLIPSLRAYLVAEHDRRHVTFYSRESGGDWASEEFTTSGRLAIPCPATTLSLEQVYEGVEMPPLRVREDGDEDEDAEGDDDEWAELLHLPASE